MRRLTQALLVVVALAAPAWVALRSAPVSATIAYESPYTFEQTFGSALRLIRVDLGCKITEKDTDNGYLLFEYTSPESGKRVHRGSIEIVRGKRGAHVSVQLPSLPQYHEQMVIDSLVKKLAAEHGEPPQKSKATPSDDAGVDGSPTTG